VDGELWSARRTDGNELPHRGGVSVVARDGMTLIVEPLEQDGLPQANESKES
nr:NfeD family protein [Chloroflexota bacterium]